MHTQDFSTNSSLFILAIKSSKGTIINCTVSLQNGDGSIRSNVKLGRQVTSSAITSCNYLILNSSDLDIDKTLLLRNDVHINFDMLNENIINDGPSAGLAIFLSLYTQLKSIKLKQFLAVTGEISLSGKILSVSNIEEKLKAAEQQKITTVIIPGTNFQEIKNSTHLFKNIHIIAVNNISDLLAKMHLIS